MAQTAAVMTTKRHWRRHSASASMGAIRATYGGLENVAMPTSAAAAYVDAGERRKRLHLAIQRLAGAVASSRGGATSLYDQRNSAYTATDRLKISGVSQTRYTGAAEAMKKTSA